jgi:hypothetical protein
VTADRTALYSVDDLSAAHQHVNAVLASGALNRHERSHLLEVRDRIEEGIKRKRREEPRPLRGPAAWARRHGARRSVAPGPAVQARRFEDAHPQVEIVFLGSAWQGVIPRPHGEDIVTRYELGALLDVLE